MPEPRTERPDAPDVSRRDFLTRRFPGRVAALLGGGATVASATASAAAGPDGAGAFSARDLRRMSRDQVRAALARIRARRRSP
jgi:hypothetical protein